LAWFVSNAAAFGGFARHRLKERKRLKKTPFPQINIPQLFKTI
jgi:hypothetical protein